MYGCKLYDGVTLVRDLIPVIQDGDDQVGLFDLINNKFYGNKGSGSFIAGDNLSTVSITVSPANTGTVTGEGDYIHGSSVTVSAAGDGIHSFAGWYDDSGLISTSSLYTYTPSGNVVIEARFEER